MNWVDLMGLTAALLGASMSAPQLISILRTRNIDGVSLASWQLVAGVVISWMVHGFIVDRALLYVANFIMGSMAVWIVHLVASARGIKGLNRWGLVIGIAAVCSTVDLLFGSAAYGVVVLIPSALGILAQMRDLIRSPDVSGVSVVFLVINGTNLFLWALWGYLTGDAALVITGSINGTFGATNLAIYLFRMATRRTQRVALADASSVGACR